jgi:tetratricopeptide (TPR) repeat protein
MLQLVTALNCKAGTLGRMYRVQERDALFESVVREFADSDQVDIRAYVAQAFLWRARDPLVKARSEQVVAVLDELLRRFSQDREPVVEVVVAQAMFDRAEALGNLKRNPDLIAAYDDFISRFDLNQDRTVMRLVAKAHCRKASILGDLQDFNQQVDVYNTVLQRYSSESDEGVREFVSNALLGLSQVLAVQKKPAEAIAALDELVIVQTSLRWGMQPRRLAEILLRKGKMLELAGEREAASATYERLMEMGPKTLGPVLWLIPFTQEARSGIARLQT